MSNRPARHFAMAVALALGLSCSGEPEGERPRTSTTASVETVVQADTGFYQELSWSPDGSTLLVSVMDWDTGDDGYVYRVFRIAADGTGFRALTDGPRDYWTTWSPDGSRIAFASRRNGDFDLYSTDPRGGALRRLTGQPGVDTHPDWSPDGSRIAFVSEREGKPEVYLMNADGTGQRRVGEAGGEVWNPVFSPDGRRLAFYETTADGEDHVWIMDVEGGERRRLVPGVWPSWSPDGARILFTGSDGLYQADRDGGDPTRLVAGDVVYGRFSPDGSRLAYIANESGDVLVCVAAADGSGRSVLLRRPRPAW